MPSAKLFHDQPDCFNFNAKIEEIIGNSIALDKTFFYPRGGHQDSDRGSISYQGHVSDVVDVQEAADGRILHRITTLGPIVVGAEIRAQIDIERRKYLSTLHSCQHIISHLVLSRYGIATRRSDFTDKGGLIVFEEPIKQSWAPELESEIDALIAKDITLASRWEKDRRFVAIQGLTEELCGGTHINSTKDIIAIFILDIDSCKFSYDVGLRGLTLARKATRELLSLKRLLGGDGSPYEQVERLMEQHNEARSRLNSVLSDRMIRELRDPKNAKKLGSVGVVTVLDERDVADPKVLKSVFKSVEWDSLPSDIFIIGTKSKLWIVSKIPSLPASGIAAIVRERWPDLRGGGNSRQAEISLGDMSLSVVFSELLLRLEITINAKLPGRHP